MTGRIKTTGILILPIGIGLAAYFLMGKPPDSKPASSGQARTFNQPFALKNILKGVVVFERPDGIYSQGLGAVQPEKLLSDARYPRWSPDGTRVACIQDNRIVEISVADKHIQEVAGAEKPRALAYHPDGVTIFFSDGENLMRADRSGGQAIVVSSGGPYYEIDVTFQGKRMVATTKGPGGLGWQVRALQLEKQKQWKVAGGCSASLSPDGLHVTHLLSNHLRLQIRHWKSGEFIGEINAPDNMKFDNHFWSNHPDWIASESEGEQRDIYAHYVPMNLAYQVTTTGDCGRPDLFIIESSLTLPSVE